MHYACSTESIKKVLGSQARWIDLLIGNGTALMTADRVLNRPSNQSGLVDVVGDNLLLSAKKTKIRSRV